MQLKYTIYAYDVRMKCTRRFRINIIYENYGKKKFRINQKIMHGGYGDK